MPACQELEAAFREAWADPAFRTELDDILRDYAGRPSILTECHNLGGRLGVRLLLKREDLNHTGSHKINNVLGQALLAKRMGKTRLVAETGAGQHGVATATAAALLGLECKVYMGAVDVDRQALNVFRMRMLGADVEAVHSGSRTLKDAVNEAMRDWVATVGDTHYCLGSVMGPHPYPWMVRELHRVIGDEAREQTRALTGDDPDVVVACVGGGSNAAGLFAGFVDTPARLVGAEPAGGAAVGRGVPGVVHGMRSYLMQDEHGQVEEAHSVSAGLDYPGRRAGALVPALDRAGRVPAGDRRRGARRVLVAGPHGGDPVPRSSPPTPSPGSSGRRRRCRARPCVVCLSGRGDKDVAQAMDLIGGRTAPRADVGRMEEHFRAARAEGRKLLVPYITGGYPGLGGRHPRRRGQRGRRDRDRHPVLRPGDGRPGDPAGVAGRARRRHHAAGRARRGGQARRRDPARRDDVLQPRPPRRSPPLRRAPRGRRHRRVHPARPPARGSRAVVRRRPTTPASRR